MSLSGCTGDALRGTAIVGGACALAWALLALRGSRGVQLLLVLWLAIPALAIGYAWAALPLAGLHGALTLQLLHGLLAAFRFAPLALMVVCILPAPPLSAAAWHCLRLGARHSPASLAWQWWSRGPGRRWLVAGLTAFPLAFGEFEISSRLDVGAWSVRLFDAQAGGQFLAVTLLQALPGVLIQAAALVAAWLLVGGSLGAPGAPPACDGTRARRALAWLMLSAGSLLLLAVPAATLAWDATDALAAAAAQATMLRHEIAASLLFAGVSALCAWLIAGVLSAGPAHSLARRVLPAALLLPGLCGSLAVGVAVLALCQLPVLHAAAATPLPLTAALVLVLLPYALVLRLYLSRQAQPAAWHQAQLLAHGDAARAGSALSLAWVLKGRRHWWCFAVIFAWAYGDLAASAILHPVDMTPVLVRLYNLMHYGRSSALSIQLSVALFAGVAALAVAYTIVRLHRQLLGRWTDHRSPRSAVHV